MLALLCLVVTAASAQQLSLDQSNATEKRESSLNALQRIQVLIEGGANGLAERLLLKQQPAKSNPDDWMRWETQLWDLYEQTGQWQKLIARFDQAGTAVATDYLIQLQTRVANAHLNLNDGAAAQKLVSQLLWQYPQSSPVVISHWRRLLIRAFVLQSRLQDAQIALANYRSEYLPSDVGWQSLYATTLLSAQKPELVSRELASLQTPLARAFTLLSRLRDNSYSADVVIQKAQQIADHSEENPILRLSVELITAEAALDAENLPMRVQALEQIENTDTRVVQQSPLRSVTTANLDELLQAYVELARKTGNSHHLLVGDDYPWLQQARELLADFPLVARAIFVLLIRESDNEFIVDAAHSELIASLLKANLERLLNKLYGDKGRLSTYEALPDSTAYLLAERALEQGQIKRAASLTRHLSGAPQGVDLREWQLRQARMAIYAKEFDRAIGIITKWLAETDALDEGQADRLLQIIFDLQSVDEHQAALTLLRSVQPLLSSPRQKRENFYWQADSLNALSRHDEAAESYLTSAVRHGDINDMWGQASRYRAAQAMTKAGLNEDARSIYKTLLRVTEDRDRRAELQRRLQELWLLDAADTTTL